MARSSPEERAVKCNRRTETGQVSVQGGFGRLSGDDKNARNTKSDVHADEAHQDDFNNAHDSLPFLALPVCRDRRWYRHRVGAEFPL